MFHNILIATDGSALANKAIAAGITLGRSSGARLAVLLVVPDYSTAEYAEAVVRDGMSRDALRQRLAEKGLEKLEAVLQPFGAADFEVERHVAVDDDPHAQILIQARRLQSELIIMASRGRGPLKSALLGSQTLAVLANSPIPVLVIK